MIQNQKARSRILTSISITSLVVILGCLIFFGGGDPQPIEAKFVPETVTVTNWVYIPAPVETVTNWVEAPASRPVIRRHYTSPNVSIDLDGSLHRGSPTSIDRNGRIHRK